MNRPNSELRQRTGEHISQGTYANGKLILTIHPLRVEWRYIPSEDTSVLQGEIPVLGPFLEQADMFHKLSNQWFQSKNCPPLVRLAFGAEMVLPVDNHVEGYHLLSSYLPFEVDGVNSSDFRYQINRRRDSKMGIPDLKINRLSKWSILRVQAQIGSPAAPTAVRQLPDLYACNLELDINTTPDFDGELQPDDCSRIFNELIELGKEIAQEGDIP